MVAHGRACSRVGEKTRFPVTLLKMTLNKRKNSIIPVINFSFRAKTMYSANREDILNMSNKELEMSISSGEIDVSAE